MKNIWNLPIILLIVLLFFPPTILTSIPSMLFCSGLFSHTNTCWVTAVILTVSCWWCWHQTCFSTLNSCVKLFDSCLNQKWFFFRLDSQKKLPASRFTKMDRTGLQVFQQLNYVPFSINNLPFILWWKHSDSLFKMNQRRILKKIAIGCLFNNFMNLWSDSQSCISPLSVSS